MILGPQVSYRLPWSPALTALEVAVPGVEVHAWVGNWTRWDKVSAQTLPLVQHAQLRVALHSAWLLHPLIQDQLQDPPEYSPDCAAVYTGVFTDQHRAWLRAYGDTLCTAAWQRGELTDYFMDIRAPYQTQGAAWFATRPWALFRWNPGCLTGDTEMVINRGGKSFRVSLERLYFKFHGGSRSSRDAPWMTSIKTQAQSVDADGFRRLNHVVDVVYSGVKTVYEVTVSTGEQVKATEDHKFMTPSGWVPLRDLSVGMTVTTVDPGGRVKWAPDEMVGKYRKNYYEEQCRMHFHPYAVHKLHPRKDRPGPQRASVVPRHRVIVEAHINGMSFPDFVERCCYGPVDGLQFLDPQVYHVHHKDRNTRNNSIDNLEIEPVQAHLTEHGKEHNWQNCTKRVRSSVITRILPKGDLPTYDVCMAAPLHNFVASGFVVHNSGKSAGALAAVAAYTYQRILVLCPAAARKEWRADSDRAGRRPSSVEKFTTWETFRLMPAGYWAKATESLEEGRARGLLELSAYLDRNSNRRQILVLGMESMGDHLDTVRRFKPQVLVVDELHKLGDNGAWKCLADAEGGRIFETAKTKTGAKTRAVEALEVCHARSIRARLALSGTPLDDGKPRRLYMPLHLLTPGGFGRYSGAYAMRYCDKHLDAQGYPDDSGESHMDELRQRCAFFTFDVPRSETHEAMKDKLRIEVDNYRRADLGAPVAIRREIARLQKLARSGDRAARGQLREALLAEAASMKRSIVLARAEEFLKAGNKVMIYLSRHEMCDDWGEALRKRWSTGWVAHGGIGNRKCDEAVNAYDIQEGGCWLIGTWDAIGESKNGMQGTHLGVVAQMPLKPAQWTQGVGRWDRMDGVGTLVWVPVADDTQDVLEIMRLTRKFGTIEKFIQAPELGELAELLEGGDDVVMGLADKLSAGGRGGCSDDDE